MSRIAHDDIAVLAAKKEDGQLVSELLNDAGFQVGTFRNATELEQSTIPARAMVVCHRRSSNTPAPGIPRARRHQRVVVLSDCYTEELKQARIIILISPNQKKSLKRAW